MRRIIYWIFILALQVFVLNHLDISIYLVPQVFIILLIGLRLDISRMLQILIAFGVGLLIDFFTSTPGINASASLWLMVLRMAFLDRQDLKEHIANKQPYSLKVAGTPYLYTVSVLVVFYHLYIFWMESIGAIHWGKLLSTTLISSVLALTIISILEYISLSSSE